MMDDEGATPCPPPVNFEDDLLTLDVHPSTPLLACGTIDGHVSQYMVKDNCTQQLLVKLLCKDSCRSLAYSRSGTNLHCGMKGQLLYVDSERFDIISSFTRPHNAPLNKVYGLSERLIASGDDNGCIKVWDVRAKKEVFSISDNTDFISDMISNEDKQILLCTSGDGSLSAIDLRQRQLEQRSDCSESEQLCISLVKGSSKVVCGDSEGILGIFTWGLWGDNIDRYPVCTKNNSVDSCVQLSDSVICIGGMDGRIRAVQILPNKIICQLGHHSKHHSVDVLRVLKPHEEVLVSGSYDAIKFWNTSGVPSVWLEDAEECEEKKKTSGKKRRRKRRSHLNESPTESKRRNTFFDNLQ